MITKKQEQAILRGIWRGNITVFSPPEIVYDENRNKLSRGTNKGYGGSLSKFATGSPDFKTLEGLQDNVTFFSAAKTFQQTNDMSALVFDEQGFLRPFTDFQKDASVVFDTFNRTWLKTEFEMSVKQAQSASQWVNIQATKEELPILQYQTADDERVRAIHSSWDNIVRPTNDPFWNGHMPPNGWGCRCIVLQLAPKEKRVSSLSGVAKNDDKLFAHNPGKSKEIFKEKGQGQHPYFSVDKKFETLKSNNFNLPK